MDIVLTDGSLLLNKSPVAMCTGYRAKSLIMKKGDFEELRNLAYNHPTQFYAVMAQLEGRFA